MKNIHIGLAAALAFALLANAGAASAASMNLNSSTSLKVNGIRVTTSNSVTASSSASSSMEMKGNATSSMRNKGQHGAMMSASSSASTTASTSASSTRSMGSKMSDMHRSTVAKFVQNLHMIADRAGGIGEQVRVIAQAQENSSSTTAAALAKIEARGGFKTLLVGSDYKNIGTLKSEWSKTEKAINDLKLLVASTTDAQVKADLNAQITVLQAEQAKVAAFVKAHEGNFSLFGWFVNMFN
jgi:hypothetical protein